MTTIRGIRSRRAPACLAVMLVTLLMVQVAVGAEAATGPADTDDVMRPTKHGIRLTPAMARLFSQKMVDGDDGDIRKLDLTDEQKPQMSELTARRMMQLGHRHGQHLQPLLETLAESMILHHGRFTQEAARELGEKALPVMPGVHELVEGFLEDARGILTPEQFAKLEEQTRKDLQNMGRFENKMKRWADGRANEGEELDHYEPEDGEPPESEKGDDAEPANQKLQIARWMARRGLARIGPAEWEQFVEEVKYFFTFTDEQKVQADDVLADFRQQAEAVMTDDWKATVRRNRIRFHLKDSIGDLPAEPWLEQLKREYTEAVAPVEELGKLLRAAILALVTDEQWQAALAQIRERAARHGLPEDGLEVVEQQLAALKQQASAPAGDGK